MAAELDRNIASEGFNMAINHFLHYFITEARLQAEENVPTRGPLLVVCNHPAAYDAAILAAHIKRDDLKMLGSDVHILRMLPNFTEHIIPVPYNIPARLMTVRDTIKQLNSGGAVLIFPRGNVEPDPAISPGAEASLAGWSPSIEIFLRKVPETITVVAIVSGLLSPKWYKNPVFNLWKKYEQRQKVVEIFQVASQLFSGRTPDVHPLITFSPALTVPDLGGVDSTNGKLF